MPWVKLSTTFNAGSTYTTLSPRGLHWRCPFANSTVLDTHPHADAHTFWMWTRSCVSACECAHWWSNYRRFNHWTLLPRGTADIAGSGQKQRPLTDFNLGLMTVASSWMVYCTYHGRCHFFSDGRARIKNTLWCARILFWCAKLIKIDWMHYVLFRLKTCIFWPRHLFRTLMDSDRNNLHLYLKSNNVWISNKFYLSNQTHILSKAIVWLILFTL